MSVRDSASAPSERIDVAGECVHAWHGIRYATAPERFAPSLPATGRPVVSRQHEVPIFPQLSSRLWAAMGNGKSNPQTEDAFFLNIWAPAYAQGLPVLLFIHGGAWMTGGGAMEWYDGSRLASMGLVVVNVNYRIGPLGHMGRSNAHALPLPAADLLLALKWVIDNIRAYGGDADKITLMGQSSGGWYCHLLSVLPETRGMFEQVALLSMGTRSPWSAQYQMDVTATSALNVDGDLGTAPVNEVLKAGVSALQREPLRLGHAPSAFLPVASEDLPRDLLDPRWAANACHVNAVYIRNTADESAAFFFNVREQREATQHEVDDELSQWPVADLPPQLIISNSFAGAQSGMSPYRQLVAAASWRQFERFPSEYGHQLQQLGTSVRSVKFDLESSLVGFHSGHCLDLPFQFGNAAAWTDAPMLAGVSPDHFQATSEALIADIAAFALCRPRNVVYTDMYE